MGGFYDRYPIQTFNPYAEPYDQNTVNDSCIYVHRSPQSSNDFTAPVCYMQGRYIISDRAYFDSSHQFSAITLIANTTFTNGPLKYEKYIDNHIFNGKKVLVLIHGFKASISDIRSTLEKVASGVEGIYDAVIAYAYPACAVPFQYEEARNKALYAAQHRLPQILAWIALVAERVDVAAHSMGAFLALNALNQSACPKITNLFLLGGAVGEKSVLPNYSPYICALQKVENIYSLYSCNDKILPWHTFLTQERTLGRPGALPSRMIADNVHLVNASDVVSSHSAYLTSQAVMDFVKQTATLNNEKQGWDGKDFVLNRDGLFMASEQKVCSDGMGDAVSGIVNTGMRTITSSISNVVNPVFTFLDLIFGNQQRS